MMKRRCGDCTLCCKLVPVQALKKLAGQSCMYQRFGKGCTVYGKREMPSECVMWNCRWLVNDDTGDLSRPDRVHYVIDIMPDFITVTENDTGIAQNIQVVQVWVDPKHPDAHRDPALRRYLERRAQEGIAAIIRYSAKDAFVLLAPPFIGDGQWHEHHSASMGRDHTAAETARALGGKATLVFGERGK
jgi:hypothetical protein